MKPLGVQASKASRMAVARVIVVQPPTADLTRTFTSRDPTGKFGCALKFTAADASGCDFE
jgi:hypothetical protein